MAEKKEKRYVSDNAQLMAEWDWEKNNEFKLYPNQITCGSRKKVWWVCHKGHKYAATIPHRNEGRGCPYCAGKKVLIGFNDLKTINPHLSNEWDYERNSTMRPEHFVANSGKKVWWRCNNGHTWQATISARNHSGTGCPYCAGNIVLAGVNDLRTINPNLASEWNCGKNGDLRPEYFAANSNRKVWWKCTKGHEWLASIAARHAGNNCPYCAGRKVLVGYNDLKTVNPDLVREWDYKKNKELKPEDFVANSHKKVWWKCVKNHEWQATITDRNQGHGCPICFSEQSTSFPEYALIYYLEKQGVKTIHSYKELGYELDVYIPTRRIAIEFDGYYWHKNKQEKDLEKNYNCKRDGIKLYRIREGLPPLNDSSIDYVIQKNHKDLPKVIEKIIDEITHITIHVDIKTDSIAIENLREHTQKIASLLLTNPPVASEWNYEKNEGLRPEYFTANSHKKVWWKCSNGHEWQASIKNRNNGSGCPYCSGRNPIPGITDLQTVNPLLAQEWNFDKNRNEKPEHFTANSNKKVWWKCTKGHEWQATINSRAYGNGCPYCSNHKILKGYNDLQTINHSLAKEWNFDRNNNTKPELFGVNSHKKVWWLCPTCSHEWEATIASRNSGRGCPKCAKEKRKNKTQ